MTTNERDPGESFSGTGALGWIAAGVSLLLGMGCGVEPETGPLRRAFTQADLSPVATEVGGITRQAVSLQAIDGGAIELPLGPEDPPVAPFLLVWRVGSPAAVSEEAVDPATRERLPALGYEW